MKIFRVVSARLLVAWLSCWLLLGSAHAQFGQGYTPSQSPQGPISPGGSLGPLTNYQGSGFPALAIPSRLIIYQSTVTNNDFATLQLERTTAFTATNSNVNSNLRATTNVGTNDGTNTWPLLGICNTVSTAAGTCAGVTGHGTRNTGGTEPVWGGVAQGIDATDTASSGTGGTVGWEVDVDANLLDTATNAKSISGAGNRVGLQVAIGRQLGSDNVETEITYGQYFSTQTTNIHTDAMIGTTNDYHTQYGLDMRGALAPNGSSNPVIGVALAAGQQIEFNGPASGGTAFAGTPVNTLTWTSSGTKFQYLKAGTEFFSISDAGVTTFSGPSGILFTATDPAATIINGAHFGLTYNNGVNTWTLGANAGTNLIIQAGGAGTVGLHQVQTAANGSVATTVTSLGPTGSHATIQEWLVVTNSSGVTRWIPAY